MQLESEKIDLFEYQGDEDFIIKHKCKDAFKIINKPVIVEDTSLKLSAFNGLPGPYIKYFLDKIGAQSLFRMLKDWDDKEAIAECRIAFTSSINSEPLIFLGQVKGHIVSCRGQSGFGFDFCFQPVGHSKTFAEMGIYEKNKISHRYLAIENMRQYFQSH